MGRWVTSKGRRIYIPDEGEENPFAKKSGDKEAIKKEEARLKQLEKDENEKAKQIAQNKAEKDKLNGKREISLEQKKQYLRDNNLTRFAKELNSSDTDEKGAVEYVYDQHTLSTEEFRKKYFGNTDKKKKDKPNGKSIGNRREEIRTRIEKQKAFREAIEPLTKLSRSQLISELKNAGVPKDRYLGWSDDQLRKMLLSLWKNSGK